MNRKKGGRDYKPVLSGDGDQAEKEVPQKKKRKRIRESESYTGRSQ